MRVRTLGLLPLILSLVLTGLPSTLFAYDSPGFGGLELLGETFAEEQPVTDPSATNVATDAAADGSAAPSLLMQAYPMPVPVTVLVLRSLYLGGGCYLVFVERMTWYMTGLGWAYPCVNTLPPASPSFTGAGLDTAVTAAEDEAGLPAGDQVASLVPVASAPSPAPAVEDDTDDDTDEDTDDPDTDVSMPAGEAGKPGQGREAVRWATEDAEGSRNPNNGELGHTAWHGWCLGMVARAWSIGVGRTVPELQAATARLSMENFRNAGKLRPVDGPLPAGAPVFWDVGSVGHVAIATGEVDANGEPLIASTWVGGSEEGIFVKPLSWFTRYVGRPAGYGVVN